MIINIGRVVVSMLCVEMRVDTDVAEIIVVATTYEDTNYCRASLSAMVRITSFLRWGLSHLFSVLWSEAFAILVPWLRL